MKPGYKLKDFARITNLSRKALLLYEKKGLLVPELVDEKTGYRYYSKMQLRRAAVLSFLRNFEIPLTDYHPILDGTLTLKKYFSTGGRRLDLLRRQIKINHVLQTLQISEYNEQMLSDQAEVVVLPQMVVVSLEGKGDTRDISLHFSLMNRFIAQYAIRTTGASFTWYFKDSNIEKYHFKACVPIENYIQVQHPDIRCELIPSVKIAYMYHFGDYETLYLTYKQLNHAMKERGWCCRGDYMETYLVSGDRKYTDSSSFVTSVSGILE